MPDRTAVVRVDRLEKHFRPGFGIRKKQILHGISFRVRRGEIFGFVGPNGAGKTTTLKVLMGLIRPTAGRASILGHDVHETEFRRHVGFLPENPYFYDHLSGRETLDFYARLCGVRSSERARRVNALLRWVGLSQAADARLRFCSAASPSGIARNAKTRTASGSARRAKSISRYRAVSPPSSERARMYSPSSNSERVRAPASRSARSRSAATARTVSFGRSTTGAAEGREGSKVRTVASRKCQR